MGFHFRGPGPAAENSNPNHQNSRKRIRPGLSVEFWDFLEIGIFGI
jgi:hypothetical protein